MKRTRPETLGKTASADSSQDDDQEAWKSKGLKRSACKAVNTRVVSFFLVQITQKWGKCTKWPQTIPNGHNLYQMTKIYSKLSQNMTTTSIPRPSKFDQIGIFGLKINHLATLGLHTRWRKEENGALIQGWPSSKSSVWHGRVWSEK
jgi:hypothetical protein